jgi:uncharacterized membrane protein
MTLHLLMAMAAGLAFSLIAVAYRACSARGIAPCFPAMGMGLAGMIVFGFRSFAGPDAPGYDAPAAAWIWGAINGAAQGFSVYLYRLGLQRGPLGPVWCASNLTFVTPALFAVAAADERLSSTQIAGMAAAVLCVVAAAMGHRSDAGPSGQVSAWRAKFVYAGILALLVFLCGLVGVGLKHLAMLTHHGVPVNPRWNDCFMLGLYTALLAWVAASSAACGRPTGHTGALAGYSLLAAAGSVAGMALTARVSDWPGGIGFAVLAVTAVLAGSLIASFGFGEKRGPFWYLTLALATAALILFQT